MRFVLLGDHINLALVLLDIATKTGSGDRAFGFAASHLPAWVEEKTSGRIGADAVASLSLEAIRLGGPERVRDVVLGLRPGSVVVANAVEPVDMAVVALGCLMAEVEGPRRAGGKPRRWRRAWRTRQGEES